MIFVDTSAFLAKYLQNDQYHSLATEIWEELSNSNVRLFTSNLVISETLTLLGMQAGYEFAAERSLVFYSSKLLTILRPNLNDELRALHFFSSFSSLKVSFTDCISFALLENYSIQKVLAFDIHFEIAGFELIRNKNR